MEKLVVTYSWGDMECCGESYTCILYESAEALYIHLEEKVLEWIKATEGHYAAYKIWDEQSDKLRHHAVSLRKQISKKLELSKKAEESWSAHMLLRPTLPTQTAIIGGKEFDLTNFTYFNEANKIREVDIDIKTLDEWFESHD